MAAYDIENSGAYSAHGSGNEAEGDTSFFPGSVHELTKTVSEIGETEARHPIQNSRVPDNMDGDRVFKFLVEQEKNHDIKYRTMSWQRCALLLFGDQVCLAIMAQAWTLKVLGWVPGLITQVLSGILFWITSYTMWLFIMKVRALASAN